MIDLACCSLGKDRGFARPVIDCVPHDVDLAAAKRGEFAGWIFEQHKLHVDAVFRFVLRAGIRLHAVIENDARCMAGPGVDADDQRPVQTPGAD